MLYMADTPTNVFPSLHVFNSLAACIAIYESRELRKHKLLSMERLYSGRIDYFSYDVFKTTFGYRCDGCIFDGVYIVSVCLCSREEESTECK